MGQIGHSVKDSNGTVWFRNQGNRSDMKPFKDVLGNTIDIAGNESDYEEFFTPWYDPLTNTYISSKQLQSVVDTEAKDIITEADYPYYEQKPLSWLDKLAMQLRARLGIADNTFFGKFLNGIRNIINIVLFLLLIYIIYKISVFLQTEFAKQKGRLAHA
jgi:hypothetical protein